jgi:UDP-N-acetylglucosamine 2-epimerase (non-hydrolysing)
MATSLACFYANIPVGHVEAGLRTYNKAFPFPEEMNRVLTDTVADLHFAPTQRSVEQLRRLGVPDEGIVLTGNTVIDALHHTLAHASPQEASPITLAPGQRLVLATVHRRENFGEPLEAILRALLTLLSHCGDVVLALPVHPNPNVKHRVEAVLGNHPRVHLLAPQEYGPFCQLLQQATLILTDSGGVQEEAPSLGKPVLVLRRETERPEAVEAGTVKLVGADEASIVTEALTLLTNPEAYAAMQRAVNPYGDGLATPRLVEALLAWQQQRPARLAGLPWWADTL